VAEFVLLPRYDMTFKWGGLNPRIVCFWSNTLLFLCPFRRPRTAPLRFSALDLRKVPLRFFSGGVRAAEPFCCNNCDQRGSLYNLLRLTKKILETGEFDPSLRFHQFLFLLQLTFLHAEDSLKSPRGPPYLPNPRGASGSLRSFWRSEEGKDSPFSKLSSLIH